MQKLTREQAEKVWETIIEPLLSDDSYYHNGQVKGSRERLDEITVQPGDHEFCWPGEGKRCYCYRGEGMMHIWPEAWEGPMKCTHSDAKPGECPLELHRCGGRLMPASFIVEDTQAPEGYRDANGFRCERCGEEIITAQEARRIEQMDIDDKTLEQERK